VRRISHSSFSTCAFLVSPACTNPLQSTPPHAFLVGSFAPSSLQYLNYRLRLSWYRPKFESRSSPVILRPRPLKFYPAAPASHHLQCRSLQSSTHPRSYDDYHILRRAFSLRYRRYKTFRPMRVELSAFKYHHTILLQFPSADNRHLASQKYPYEWLDLGEDAVPGMMRGKVQL
jgi:hypothetical protein